MAYNKDEPHTHFVVELVIREVTPAHRTSSGVGSVQVDRQVEETLRIVARDSTETGAMDIALAHLQAARA